MVLQSILPDMIRMTSMMILEMTLETIFNNSVYMEQQGYTLDITDQRLHHEIYLSDARKVAPEKLKTVIRHPIRER